MTDNPKIIVENSKCESCEMHGDCPIEFVGGEDNLLTEKEMDRVTALVEIGFGDVAAHWDAHKNDRETLENILKAAEEKGEKHFVLGTTKEGKAYSQFAIRQAERMDVVVKKVMNIMLEATKRAEEAFLASKSNKN